MKPRFFLPMSLLTCLLALVVSNARGELIFQDFFTSPVSNLTNSTPWIDVQGSGWQTGDEASQLWLDGNGHVYNGAAAAQTGAGVPLIPIGPHGTFTASAVLQLPVNSSEWIGLGFASSNSFLSSPASGSGPWLQVFGNGTMTLYGGAGLSNAVIAANAFTNSGSPFAVFLTCDNYHATASAGTIGSGGTNFIFNQWPLTNSAGAPAPRYGLLQMSTNLTTPTARWAAAVAVDWIPRPPPMLTLPEPVWQTNFVGVPGTNDILLIQNAFAGVSNSGTPTEIRFTAGATYVISNSSPAGAIPDVLSHATNVLVNGNGCRILITNPRLGFLSVNQCSNVIVENFLVDHDPLPYTQGTITHNFCFDPHGEQAIEFQVDAGYPAPTNANYIDASASSIARRWGTVMDPGQAGRGADNSFTACLYTNVIQTNANGAYKVYLTYTNQALSIPVGARWNMISRWNGSSVFTPMAPAR